MLYQNGFRLYADSAVHRDRHPLFLPDSSHGWMAYICPCVRISRLGMNISPEFAHRYYDSIGVAAIIVPEGSEPDFASLDEQYFAMDSAYTVGEMFPCDTNILAKAFGQEITFDAESLDVDSAIARLSCFMTFKTGDLLFFAGKGTITTPIAEGDEVVVYINKQISLDIKIK